MDGQAPGDQWVPATPAQILIVIPARDEEHRIAASLDAIGVAARCQARSTSVVVVDNASTDRTADRARTTIGGLGLPHLVIRSAATTVGGARHAGILEAIRRGLVPAGADTWVLSTDADTLVPPRWIASYLAHAADGATAVAGIVELIPDDDSAHLADRWATDYGSTLAADRTHPHVHAANLGVRLDRYLLAGGFPDVARAEDIRLWEALRRQGDIPRSDTTLIVATSARPDHRAPDGFGAALRRLYPAGSPRAEMSQAAVGVAGA